ncbi:MAG: FmdB family transcriptional regulator [Candidatus Eremiobacteraeota bacterium]|nr:FmdB family transcriptional regulator [Candidatus Eremiobacteraeota bacterium]MBC5826683.1 FmdB family transcriptional regulator [Candidatus Eremiobacteraeota bacterium]
MPVYEYRCKDCGRTHEIEHGIRDERPTKCPTCGGVLVRVFHPVGLVFKGSGFHKTDYGARAAGRQGNQSESGDGAAKPAGEKTSESKSGDAKPAGDGKTAPSKGGSGESASASGATKSGSGETKKADKS